MANDEKGKGLVYWVLMGIVALLVMSLVAFLVLSMIPWELQAEK